MVLQKINNYNFTNFVLHEENIFSDSDDIMATFKDTACIIIFKYLLKVTRNRQIVTL